MAAFNFIEIRDTLHTQTIASLTGTEVYKYPKGGQQIKKNTTDDVYEWVEFDADMRVSREIETFGPNGIREDTVVLSGRIVVEAPGQGDEKGSRAETRAQTMLNLMETGVLTDDTLGAEGLVAWFSQVSTANGATDRGRACQLDFEITVEAHNQ